MGHVRRLFASAHVVWLLAATSAQAKTPAPEPANDLPPVSLKMSLTDSGPEAEWILAVENTSSVPVDVFDDARTLWLEVAVPGGKKPVTCKLPAEMAPKSTTPARMKTLKPGESVHHRLDPRFYCFSPGAQKVLVPSAQVTPHYGFADKTKATWKGGKRVEEILRAEAPFVAEPTDASSLGPAKNVSGEPLVLDARYAAWTDQALKGEREDGEEPETPTLEMVRGSDASQELNVTSTIRVRNPMKHRLALFLRRELLTFEVLTPSGSTSCDSDDDDRNPDRRAFSILRPGGSLSLVTRLVEFCPRGTFAAPGLYLVQAQLDAREDGAEYDLGAFVGTLHTPHPVPVRVRQASRIVPNRPIRGGATPAPGAPQGAVPPPPPPQEAAPPPPPPPPQ